MTAAGVASAQTKKLLKFSLSLFRRGFNSSKCKTAAKMAVARIKLLRNKRQVVVKQMRRDIAVLLQSGQDATARIRVEHVIREQNILAANELIELFCELIVSRLTIITKQKECPVDLKEGISSLIFAAPRCSEIPELGDLKDIFEKKYGRDFVTAATDLRPTCGVNRTLVDKLSVRRPFGEFKLKIMKEIAKEFQVDWDTTETEQELLKPQEETIDGPRAFVSASSLPVNRASHEPIDPNKAVPRQSRDSETSSYYSKPTAENRGICRRHSCNNPCIHESADHEEEEAKETMRRRHSYNSPPVPPPATSEIKFDESDYYEDETDPEEGTLQSRGSCSLPPNRAPPQAPPSQSAESRRDSSGHHVHPKLPDYDTLAARFDAIRHKIVMGKVGWSDLPEELVGLVADRLSPNIDLLRLRSIYIRQSYDVEYSNKRLKISRNSSRAVLVDSLFFVVDSNKQIWCCKSGEENSRWTRIKNEESGGLCFSDIALHRGSIYALDLKGAIWWICLPELIIYQSTVSSPMDDNNNYTCKDKRLVEYCGDLCVVYRFYNRYDIERTLCFKVYKMDDELMEWVEIKSLGNKALIVATDSCFTVLASDYYGCLENSIYFTDVDGDKFRIIGVEDEDVKVFKLGDGSIINMIDSSSPTCFQMFSLPFLSKDQLS
ncbi:unnamed protein product [Thlaspi arvense]|uniref:KIB1-4 beta-propeller domain-containing protein n=1 Tax=Thlaspi arvense TaxID=13288 RepID=A0AAU9SZ13_THLAR|nr:unnamed protein product [Thlaspi arvense]